MQQPSICLHLMMKNECFDVVFPLHERRAFYSNDAVIHFVYQWAECTSYEFVNVVDGEVKFIELLINSIPLRIDKDSISYKGKNLNFNTKCKRQGGRPFGNIFGFCDICLHLIMSDGREVYLYTDLLVVAVEKDREKYTSSLKDMLDTLYQKKRHLLVRRCCSYIGYPSLETCNDLAYVSAIRLRDLLPSFIDDNRFYKENGKDPCNLSPSDMKRRLERIAISGGEASINNIEAVPHYPWFDISRSAQSYGKMSLYEERAILSFLRSLLETAKKRCDSALNLSKDHIFEYNSQLKEGYVLSDIILEQFVDFVAKERYRESSELLNLLTELYWQYSNIFGIEEADFYGEIYPSSIFLEVPHYRAVYELMNAWFSDTERKLIYTNSRVHFASADVIYELYCLNIICDKIEELGYRHLPEKDGYFQYPNKSFRSYDYEGPNIFYFENSSDECQLTLYYQPLLYSQPELNESNGIGLFRTDMDSAKYHYRPDFLLKRIDKYGVTYGILDAKWSNRERTRTSAMIDVLNKYMCSILDSENYRPVPFLWLLQGKDDVLEQDDEEYSCGIYRRYSNIYCHPPYAPYWLGDSLGIVCLTPASGNGDLKGILQTFLSPGAFIAGISGNGEEGKNYGSCESIHYEVKES